MRLPAALLALHLALGPQSDRPFVLEVEQDSSGTRLSVHAERASLLALLEAIAAELDLPLQGRAWIAESERVDVALGSCELEDAVRWICGQAGLDARAEARRIVVEPFARLDPSGEAGLHAEAAYQEFLAAHPEHPARDEAHFALAELLQRRGETLAAARAYEALVRDSRGSRLVPEALWRSAGALLELGHDAEAAALFRELTSLRVGHEHQRPALRELARALCRTGETRAALEVLDVLEALFPAETDEDLFERLLLRARAAAAIHPPDDAFRLIELALELRPDERSSPAVLESFALALETRGDKGAASAVWLRHAFTIAGEARRRGLERAARLAAEAQDHIGVLGIVRVAERNGWGADFMARREEAERRLGIANAIRPPDYDGALSKAVDAARLALARGSAAEAVRELAPFTAELMRVAPGRRLELVSLHARALAASDALEDAVGLLRARTPQLSGGVEARAARALAAELYEEAGELELALAALEGNW